MSSRIKFLQDAEGFEFGEFGKVEAVVVEGNLQEAVALGVRHLEQVHGGIVHTHHQLHLLGLLRLEEIAVDGWGKQEDAFAEIEIVAS